MSPLDVCKIIEKKYGCKQNKAAFFSVIVFGLLAHAYMFTNKLPNYDDIVGIDKMGATIRLGRWFLWVLGATEYHLGFLFSMPWFNGCMTLLIISIAVVMIREILKIDNLLHACLLGGIIIVFPSWVGTYFFMFTALNYGIAFLFSIWGAFLLRKGKRLTATGLFICSIATYQAYITVSIGLLLLCVLLDLLEDRNDYKSIISEFFEYIGIILLSVLVYVVSVKISLLLTHQSLAEYKGIGSNPTLGAGELLNRIGEIFRAWGTLFYSNKTELCYNWGINVLYVLLFVIGVILVIEKTIEFMRTQKKLQALFFVLLYIMVELSTMSIFALNTAKENNVYVLMVLSASLLFIVPVVLIEKINISNRISNLIQWMIAGTITVTIFFYMAFANGEYLSMDLSIQQAKSYYNTLITQIKMTPGYDDDSEIIYVGREIEDTSFYDNSVFNRFSIQCRNDNLLNVFSRMEFMEYYCGFRQNYHYCESGEYSQEIQNMPCYPKDGSIRKIDNQIIVKFEDLR